MKTHLSLEIHGEYTLIHKLETPFPKIKSDIRKLAYELCPTLNSRDDFRHIGVKDSTGRLFKIIRHNCENGFDWDITDLKTIERDCNFVDAIFRKELDTHLELNVEASDFVRNYLIDGVLYQYRCDNGFEWYSCKLDTVFENPLVLHCANIVIKDNKSLYCSIELKPSYGMFAGKYTCGGEYVEVGAKRVISNNPFEYICYAKSEPELFSVLMEVRKLFESDVDAKIKEYESFKNSAFFSENAVKSYMKIQSYLECEIFSDSSYAKI
jgi:hypothetical protein